MSEIPPLREGFVIDESVHEVYRKLAKDKDSVATQLDDESSASRKSTRDIDPVSIPFSTMKDVFIWAACIGFQSGRRKPITGKRRLIFRWAQCTPQVDVPILKAIAIAESSDVSVLLNTNEIMTIAEEYANAGIYELRDSVLEGKDLPLWNLVDVIFQSVV